MGFAEWDFVLHPYGEKWRHDRRLFHSVTHMNVAPKYEKLQTRCARAFLKQLHTNSNDLRDSIRKYVCIPFVPSVRSQ